MTKSIDQTSLGACGTSKVRPFDGYTAAFAPPPGQGLEPRKGLRGDYEQGRGGVGRLQQVDEIATIDVRQEFTHQATGGEFRESQNTH